MLKFLVKSDKEVAADDVVSAASAETFLRTLPAGDPVASQRAVCDALISIKGPRGPDVDRLRALQVLERASLNLFEDLLTEYASPSEANEREARLRQPIVELSRSFALAYEYFYRHIRENPADRGWIEHAPSILVSLLRQREIDLLLALFRYEKFARGRWKDINAVYAFALERGLARIAVPVERRGADAASSITVEQAFIRILLLQLTDGGQLLPVEIAMARRWIGRFCPPLSLTPVEADAMDGPSLGFRVDLSGSQGLKRASSLHSIEGHHLQLDTSPLGAALDEASAAVRARSVDGASDALERSRQVGLLARLKILFAAERPRVRRRGERTKLQSVSVRVVIGGLQSIGRILRNESRKIVETSHTESQVEEITIGDVSDYATVPGRAVPHDVAGGFLPVVGVDGLEPLWHVQDRSESGCLLRGQTLDGEHSLPGSLMALREQDAPWQVAVVRRLSKAAGAQVELGVEYIGRNPQRVVMLADPSAERQGRFVALYLPESDAHPRIPIKTLIVPAHEYATARVLTLVSTASERRIRLKDPIEQQRDFVWAPFDLI